MALAQATLCWMGTQLPQFSVHVCCGETAGWIRIPHGTEALDGDPQTPTNFRPMSVVAKRPGGLRCHFVWGIQLPKKGHNVPTIFGPCLLWPNGWMDQDATW